MKYTYIMSFIVTAIIVVLSLFTPREMPSNTISAIEKKPHIQSNKNESNQFSEPIKKEEKELLARLVHAEAKGEPYQGKVAVATVVLNRVEHEDFPDTVHDVIYQKNQFQPVANGHINQKPSKEAVQAVDDALENHDELTDALYFWNPSISDVEWMNTLDVVKVIGDHHFAI
ncbi:cell wall hydrolase [Peribacillus asahii]|uniref:Uncharacterized protein n=1 Tax=Peribacillus asahii TaxID=228899 RepID=A0A3T0KUB6_9BACI|nr:cell wall hydrolase [Peribacillus asahii]AZV43794.1 hypothetical protein BAOM_3185 [Peribacillus asahii]USK83534.1 cell wall hydrolase [Peribacillus asahii]